MTNFDYIYILISSIAIVSIYLFLNKKGYSSKKNGKEEDLQNPLITKNKTTLQDMSPSEMLEASWKFLTRITRQVMERFSKNDQSKVMHHGDTLYRSGMGYIHVIEYGFHEDKSQELLPTKSKDQKSKQQKSR